MSTPDTERRADPDALLALTASSERGKLTVFLGAAPGVGKTYSMLNRARRLRTAGVDIVIGLVETHGRAETAALIEGLEVLPRRKVEYRGHVLEEFDIDAGLARKPQILVVDEMAHSNAEGSRHPKRYQDIAELLQAGIDVWTALNIQHLESLSDLVTRISGVEVREIVPDIALKKADEVILVDLPPAELIERLKEGKVYLPENAQRAIEGFFRPANLTALRELALRRAADRVDDQMVDFLRQGAIEGPWATAERLLVLVGSDPLSERVVRTASRLASGLNAPWTALSLARPDAATGPAESQRLDETMRLAERLGATTMRVTGEDFVTEILRIARRENITQIVVGRPRRSLFARLTHRALPDELLARSGEINVHIVAGEDEEEGAEGGFTFHNRSTRRWIETLALATAAVTIATLVGKSLTTFLPLQNVSLLYLVAVIVCGVLNGRVSAIVAAALSFLAYNFFFIEPLYTFTIAQPHELFGLVVFLAAAILGGELAGHMREQTERARRQERATQALNEFSRKLSGSARLDTVLEATAAHLYATTGMGAALLVPEGAELVIGSIWPPDLQLDATDRTAARWAFEKQEPSGKATGTLPQVPWYFRPILQGRIAIGVLGLLRPDAGGPLLPHEEQLVRGVLEQTAVAIDRARLARENVRTAALEESERLNAALFSSLSHDLKTPLATISGAASSLRELGDRMDAATREDLLSSIEEEGSRLGRFVSNLFDMTRIEAGTLKPKRDSIEIADAVNVAVERARRLYPTHQFELSLAADLPPAKADGNLLGQVLFNLIDNACKYGGEGAPVALFARREGNEVVISVTDQGKGIPEGDLERIFEKFYRRTKTDGRAPGTGLGLSIARGFVVAMGGTLEAESPAVKKRGTRFTIRLPADGGARP
ncbi:ATP-binding protein [Devosia sp. CN2-171]|uniref:ATP-binding protein n=1 Tax=Devosia sp. CN2-171 TaxID=3400909 RepID=UPI003BF92230